MNTKFLKNLAIVTLGLAGMGATAQAESPAKPWRLGLRFDQVEQTRQSLNVSHSLWNKNVFGGLSIGSQGFREVKGEGEPRIRQATDLAATIHGDVLLHELFMLTTGLELGWRRLPKGDDGKNQDHAFVTLEERVGLKQGSVYTFIGVGYRVNFVSIKNTPILGREEVPMSGVYPRIGVDLAL